MRLEVSLANGFADGGYSPGFADAMSEQFCQMVQAGCSAAAVGAVNEAGRLLAGVETSSSDPQGRRLGEEWWYVTSSFMLPMWAVSGKAPSAASLRWLLPWPRPPSVVGADRVTGVWRLRPEQAQ